MDDTNKFVDINAALRILAIEDHMRRSAALSRFERMAKAQEARNRREAARVVVGLAVVGLVAAAVSLWLTA
jgi:hypothetical protein